MTARTALVLSGGGSLGAVQVGFIRRAMEIGIQFDILVGTSVGAINASYVAFHAPGVHDCLEQLWHGLAGTRLFSRNPFTIAGSLWRSRLSLYDNRLLRRLLAEHLASDRFEEARAALSSPPPTSAPAPAPSSAKVPSAPPSLPPPQSPASSHRSGLVTGYLLTVA